MLVLFILLTAQIIHVNADETQYNHIWTSESPIIEGNSWYGNWLAIEGEYIITNEPYAEVGGLTGAGKIYVYDFEGNLIKTHQSPEPKTQNQFGKQFDVHNGVLVASDYADVDGLQDAGKLHVYNIFDDLLYTISPTIPIKNNYFGITNAVGENIILIQDGARDSTPIFACKVNLYDHNGNLIKSLYPPNPTVEGFFGNSMEISENQFYLAQCGDILGNRPVGPGYVYIYDYQGNLLNTLEAPEPEEGAIFGFTMSASDDIIVISEGWATVDGIYRAGKVHVYNSDGYLRTLVSPNPDASAWFGRDVAIFRDIIVVGEAAGDITLGKNEGKVYVFNIDGTLLQTLTAPEPNPRGYFGRSVDIQDDIIVVCEPWAEVEGQPDCGRIHVFKLGIFEFELSNLKVEPTAVKEGDIINVICDVTNTGTLAGSYSVTLKIDDIVIEEKTVSIDVGGSETVSFEVTCNTLGEFTVDINGKTGSYEVTKPSIPGFPFETVALGVALAFIVVYLNQSVRNKVYNHRLVPVS